MILKGKFIFVVLFVILCVLIGISHIFIVSIQYIHISIPACRAAILNLIKCSMLRYSVRNKYKLS
jgi:hypothetical protein